MNLRSIIVALSVSVLSGILPTSVAFAQVDNDNDYHLSVDDQISVSIFNEPELSIENVKISTSGRISMPLIGQVNVKGFTVTALEDELVGLYLKGYLKKPNVTVTITEYRPFYINGEVNNPGSYPYRKDLTVQKAVTLAGGFTERASTKSISLKSEDDVTSTKSVLLADAVKPGDVLTIGTSFF
jgi:protein involved in polysaccharide export with SLBB domain